MSEGSGAGEPAREAGETSRCWRPFASLLHGLNAVGTVWIFALMLIINADVVGRTVFSTPVPGVPELVRLSIVGIVFLQIGHTLRSGRITRVDGVTVILRRHWPRFAFALDGFYCLFGVVLFVILFNTCRPIFVRAWTENEYAGVEGYVTYPFWPIYLILLIGCACSAAQYVVFTWDKFSRALRMRSIGPDNAAESPTPGGKRGP